MPPSVRSRIPRILRGRIARGAVGIFLLRISQGAIGLLTSLLLARLLGSYSYGAYATVLALVWTLAVIANLGFRTLLVRHVAAYRSHEAWGLMRGIVRRSNQLVFSVSVVLGALVAVLAWSLRSSIDPAVLAALWPGLAILPLSALTGLRESTLRGLQRVIEGRAPEMLVQPLAFLLLTGAWFLLARDRFTATTAMSLRLVATSAAFAVGALLLRRLLPPETHVAPPVYETRDWLKSVPPLVLIAVAQMAQHRVPVLMLSVMAGPAQAGVYSIAGALADVIAFVSLAVTVPLAPSLAGHHAAGNVRQLQHLATKSSRVMVAVSLPIAIVLIGFGRHVLQLFGPEFTAGQTAFAILAIGHLLRAAIGAVSILLTMTGHERDVLKGTALSILLNVALNALLIPRWGLEGSATAVAVSELVGNGVIGAMVYSRLGIRASALGRLGRL